MYKQHREKHGADVKYEIDLRAAARKRILVFHRFILSDFFRAVHLLCQNHQFPEPGRDIVVGFAAVRNETSGTVLDPFVIGIFSTTVLSQRVERAVAEEAVEILFCHAVF